MRRHFLFLSFTLLSKTLFSQTDSLLFAIATDSRNAKGAGEPIYNGREHLGYYHAIEGIPYYGVRDWQKGTLMYQEALYKDIFLKYDLVTDELIVRHLNGFTAVTLFSPRIQSFTLGDKHFVYLTSENHATLKPGIYEEVIKGNLSIYIKRSKLLTEKIVGIVIDRKFVDNNTFFVMKNGSYFSIKKERDLLDVLNDKTNLKQWIKGSGIKYKSDPEAALIKIIEYYNQVNR